MACRDGLRPRPFDDPYRPARLFWAVPLDGPAQAHADAEQARLAGDPSLRWLLPANRHLTLLFLGDLEVGAGLRMADALKVPLSALPPFTVSLGSADWFPAASHPVVLALRADAAASLRALAAAVREAAMATGLAVDARPFRAHVTLARLGRQGRARPVLPPSPATALLSVRDVVLFESVPGSSGRHYEPVLRLPLHGVA